MSREDGSSAPPLAAAPLRPRTFAEKQPYLAAYGLSISCFSPMASLYQLTRLNPQAALRTPEMMRLSARILPHQTALKLAQMNLSTPVKEHLNPWAAFAAVGILQGGVYGQANIFFANHLKISSGSYAGMFRGVMFAGCRDMVSLGVPFSCSPWVRTHVVDALFPTDPAQPDSVANSAKQWASVLGTSVAATYMSQGLHNCQITMQADQSLSYAGVLRKAVTEVGLPMLYRGAEARVGLLLIVNILNELLLKKAWEQVPAEG
eukprot:jgi/Tetstr1/461634/TSEL_006734.t1